MPLFHCLVRHAQQKTTPFHIPGHKRGRGMHPDSADFLGESALSIDLINIAPVDDLHHPKGDHQRGAGVGRPRPSAPTGTFFSVQGTSGAIMAMILAAVRPGEKILIPRTSTSPS